MSLFQDQLHLSLGPPLHTSHLAHPFLFHQQFCSVIHHCHLNTHVVISPILTETPWTIHIPFYFVVPFLCCLYDKLLGTVVYTCCLQFFPLILYYNQTFALTTPLKLLFSRSPMTSLLLNATLKSPVHQALSGMVDNSILPDMHSSPGFQTTTLFWFSLLWLSFSSF